MSKENQNLLQRLIQGLDQIPEFRALTLLLGWYASDWDNWQVLRAKSFSPRRQEFKASIATKVGGAV